MTRDGEPPARVLVADDDPVDRLLAEEVLLAEGYEVACAADGEAAWEACREAPPDLLVLDLLMPGLDGFEVLGRLRAEAWGQEVPVLVLTGLDDTEAIERAYRLGATDFATKPANWLILAQRLRYMLRASRTARDLAERTRELEEAQRIARLGSWRWDPEGERLWGSRELRRILGIEDHHELAPRVLWDAVPADDRPEVERLWEAALRHGAAGSLLHRIVRPDGTVLRVRHRIAAEASGLRGTVLDVTREVELEERLRQAQKLEALGTLAGGIAHDFNNLLVPILGFTELALSQLPEDSPVRPGLGNVATAARRARELVRQILAFSRGGEGPVRPVCLARLVREVGRMLGAQLPPGVGWAEDLGEGEFTVLGDEARLHQVILNLCQNAVQAVEEAGGEVRVRLARAPDPDGRDSVCLEVADTGCGMPPEVRERAFEPFFTTKPVGKGTGLGLSVVYGVVKSLGGRVEVESEPGKGSTFRVFLRPAVSPAEPAPQGRVGRPRPGPLKILLVDDEETLLAFGRAVLEGAGHRVDVSADPREALGRLRLDPRRYDLVLADRSMPGMGGDELLAEMKRLRPDLVTILCTGGSVGEAPAADRVLQKPLAPDELVAAVEGAAAARPDR
ncbi:ATP-binding response regulator [Deferrisoma palaeochoriense]